MRRKYWAPVVWLLKPCAESRCSTMRSPCNEKPPCRNWTAAPLCNKRKPVGSNKDPPQPKQTTEWKESCLRHAWHHLAVEITSSTCCGFEDWFYGYCKCFEDTKSSIWQVRMQHGMLDGLIDLLAQRNLHRVLSEILWDGTKLNRCPQTLTAASESHSPSCQLQFQGSQTLPCSFLTSTVEGVMLTRPQVRCDYRADKQLREVRQGPALGPYLMFEGDTYIQSSVLYIHELLLFCFHCEPEMLCILVWIDWAVRSRKSWEQSWFHQDKLLFLSLIEPQSLYGV